MTPAVFFDRDGTLMEDVDYCGDPRDVRVFAGAREALQRLKSGGFRLIVITNQSGIGRGYFSEEDYRAVDRELMRQLGDVIDASYHCPHSPDDKCTCRKPSAELILRAEREHDLDLARSFFVGDKATDLECGGNAGVRTLLVRTCYGATTDESLANFVADDLREAAEVILRAHQSAARK